MALHNVPHLEGGLIAFEKCSLSKKLKMHQNLTEFNMAVLTRCNFKCN